LLRSPLARYVGCALSAVAGLLIATDVLPKVVVLLVLAIGVVLLAFSSDRGADRG
jgi:hypothetical protein